MREQTKVTGVILAGGLARRMGGRDKGLILYRQRPMLTYAIEAMQPVVDELVISANRNLDRYRQFGFPVLKDASRNFEGPLAGILAAMHYAHGNGIVLATPCDSPLVRTKHLQYILETLLHNKAGCCAAFDGERLHPVFLALRAELAGSLEDFLCNGQRKVGLWLAQQNCVKADFSGMAEILINVNTEQELAQLEEWTEQPATPNARKCL
jgi:molybdopterin-guanine dinucleotide biosynthesis protein A